MERLPVEVRDTILVMLPGFGAMLAVSKGWREQAKQLRDRAYQVLCELNLSRGNVAHPAPSPKKCAELLAFGIADKYLEEPPPPPSPPSPPPMMPMYVPNVPGSLPVYVPTSPMYTPISPDYSSTSPGYYSA